MTEPAGSRFSNALTDVLFSRDDVQDVIFNGTGPTMLRLTDGQVIPGPPLEMAEEQLQDFLRLVAGSGRPAPSSAPGNTPGGAPGGTDWPDGWAGRHGS